MTRRSYRTIQARYGVDKSAIARHIRNHVTKSLRKLAQEDFPMALAEEIGEPVLVAMRKLNARTLCILKAAEDAEDSVTALSAIRECRRNLELIAKLTGDLSPLASSEGQTPLQVNIVYA